MEPLEDRSCARTDCDTVFTPGSPSRIYCSKRCKKRMEARRASERAAGIVTPVPNLSEGIDAALAASLRRDEERQHAAELKKLTAQEARLRRYETVLTQCVSAYEPTPLVVEQPSKKLDLPQHEMVLCTGDWHTGARVRIHETGGVYEQSVETTRQQVFQLWDRLARLHDIESSGIHYTKLHILGLGDLIDNDDMRPSQHRSVEDVMTVQTVQAFDLFAWLIRQALTRFPTVEVDMVGGNHDRTGRNKGNAGLGELDYVDTMSYLIGAFCERVFADEPRVKIRNWQTFFGYKEVAGRRLVFEHGSSIKWAAGGYGGVPWYGVSQLPRKFAEMLGESEIFVIGHGHRPAILPNGRGWMVLNGALPATTNYEQSSFKSVHRPLQWLLSVHRKYGLTSWRPVYLDVPGTLMPGQVWEDPEHYATLANMPR